MSLLARLFAAPTPRPTPTPTPTPAPAVVPSAVPGRSYVITERRSVRARRVRLRLVAGGGVELVIPSRAGAAALAAARRFAESQHDWIVAALARQAARPARLPGMEGGAAVGAPAADADADTDTDALFFAGRRHRLAWGERGAPGLSPRAGAPDDAEGQPTLCVHGVARPAEAARRRVLLKRLLRAHARAHLGALLRAEAGRVGVGVKAFQLTDARTRWGTCRTDGVVRLHWRLVLAPPAVARYVVVHELCHRLEMNHSARFWAHVARHCPEWRAARDWLKTHGTALLGVLDEPGRPAPAAAPDAD